MKILTDEKHQEMKDKAENFDKIADALVAQNSDLKAEDITAEVVIAAISASAEPVVEQTEQGTETPEVEDDPTANATTDPAIAQLQQQISALTNELNTVKDMAATTSANSTTNQEPDSTNENEKDPFQALFSDDYAKTKSNLQELGLI